MEKDKLQYVSLPVLAHQECGKRKPTKISKRMVCAGNLEKEVGACHGDSGGPMIVQKSNTDKR